MIMVKYESKWIKYDTIPLGGYWAFVVGIIQDKQSGKKKLRIAKGKLKGFVRMENGKIKCTFLDKNDPITQVNRLNIKRRKEWKEIKRFVDEYIGILEKQQEEDESRKSKLLKASET